MGYREESSVRRRKMNLGLESESRPILTRLSKEFSDFSWVGLKVKKESKLSARLVWYLFMKLKIPGARSGCCFSGGWGKKIKYKHVDF